MTESVKVRVLLLINVSSDAKKYGLINYLLEIKDVQMVFLARFLGDVDSFEDERLVARG